jgi:hypothetical protein
MVGFLVNLDGDLSGDGIFGLDSSSFGFLINISSMTITGCLHSIMIFGLLSRGSLSLVIIVLINGFGFLNLFLKLEFLYFPTALRKW